MPNRIIKEACRTSETLELLSPEAERMFWRLITVADDYGRFEADARILLSACFPLKVGSLKVTIVEKWVEELIFSQLVSLYSVNGKIFGYFLTWDKHQQKRAKHSKHPEPPENISNHLLASAIRRNQTQSDASSSNESQNAPDSRRNQMLANVSEKREARSEKREANIVPCEQMQTDAAAVSAERGPAGVVSETSLPQNGLAHKSWPSPTALIELYNQSTPDECPAVTTPSPERIEKAKKYLRSFPEKQFWETVFVNIGRSPFLRGLNPSPGHEKFIADFDWLLTKGKDGTENVVKVHDGKYVR